MKLDLEFMKEFGLSNETHYPRMAVAEGTATGELHQYRRGRDPRARAVLRSFHPHHRADAQGRRRRGFRHVVESVVQWAAGFGHRGHPEISVLGMKIGMGVDGQASADLPDPFENMRMGLYMIRAKYESALVMQPIDVLRMHTLGSAQVLGVADKVGSLEVGKLGDIAVIDPKLMDRAPVFDPYATLVFACNTLNLEKVFLGGELLVENHRALGKTSRGFPAELATRVGRLNPPCVALVGETRSRASSL